MKEHSIFWPLVMIAAGVFWILIGTGNLPSTNLWALLQALPFLLILLGLGLILRAYWRFAGMLVSLLVVAGAVMAVVYAPRFGWDTPPSWSFNFWNLDTDIGGAVAGSGVVKSETRQVSDFNAIVMDYPAEVTIQQGKTASLKIEAEDNLLPQLSTEVQDGTLYLKNAEQNWGQRVNPTKPVIVTISVVDLNKVQFPTAGKMLIESLQTDSLAISVSGAGDVTLTGLKASDLNLNLSGAGNLKANGVSDRLQLNISGLGNFNGAELQSQEADINISGAGNAQVWVERQLNAGISGAGSIDYYGSPQVSEHISGVGNVKKLGDK